MYDENKIAQELVVLSHDGTNRGTGRELNRRDAL